MPVLALAAGEHLDDFDYNRRIYLAVNTIGKATLSSGARFSWIESQVQRCHGIQVWPQSTSVSMHR